MPKNFSAKDILSVPPSEPERLFTAPDTIKADFHNLLRTWHPDHNKSAEAADVTKHLVKLRDAAEEKASAGRWARPGEIELQGVDGKTYRLKFRKRHNFELGEMYIGQTHLVYTIKDEFRDLYENAIKHIENIDYADDAMREQFSLAMPEIVEKFRTTDRLVLVLKKDPDCVLLSDLLDHCGGKLDSKHVAWIVNRLLNLSIFFDWQHLTHNAFALNTVFVNPATHAAAVLGGWWYAAAKSDKLVALPELADEVTPPDVLSSRKPSNKTGLNLVRAVGRALLGNLHGTKLKWDKAVPRPYAEWLLLPSGGDPRADYTHYNKKLLPECFGPKRFVELPVTAADVYPSLSLHR